MVVKKKVKRTYVRDLKGRFMSILPSKYSQRMHFLEVVVGLVIISLPALTENLSVSDTAGMMLVFTILRAWLVSIKQS